jgi:hypothetical protein
VEEKEEQTLPLLKMTGASSLAILAGKSLPRLAVAVLFLCVIAPFLILSITLGGVLPNGLVSAILGMLCYAVMLSQLGLFASVVGRTSPIAFTLLCVLWAAFELCHWWQGLAVSFGDVVLGNSTLGGVWVWVFEDLLHRTPECSLISNLRTSLLSFSTSPAFNADASVFDSAIAAVQSVWAFHMTFHLVVAAVFFLLSWALFEQFTQDAATEVPAARATTSDRRFVSRAWQEAAAWKSWQFVAGGALWFWIRAIGATLTLFAVSWFLSVMSGFWSSEEVMGGAFGLGVCFFLINLARLFGKVLNQEIHGKTLSSLAMLPQPTSRTIWGLVAGILPGVLAGGVGAVLAFCLLMLSTPIDFEDFIEAVFQPWVWHFGFWIIVTIHVGLLFTTYLRYGGMLFGIALMWIVAPMFCFATIALAAFGIRGGPGSEDFFLYVIPIGLMIAECFVCFGVQKALLKRIEELASR